MANLLDLSIEILLVIISIHGKNKLDLWSLSLTCKYLNACCAHILFRKYHLCLRTSFPYSYRTNYLTPLDSVITLEKWNSDAITARLQHLRLKAPCIRHLVIEDAFQKDGLELFPESILPDLLSALQGACRITTLYISADSSTTIPLPLWNWILSKQIKKLQVGLRVAPPPGAQPHPTIDIFEGGLHTESMPFLELMRPRTIKLSFGHYYKPPPLPAYKPSGLQSSRLRSITLKGTLPHHQCDAPVFDFSGVPLATVYADFYLGVEYQMQIPRAWKSLKKKLPTLFVEGIDGYNVMRAHHLGVTLYRPPIPRIKAGWAPTHAAHRKDEYKEPGGEGHHSLRVRDFRVLYFKP